MDIAYCEKWWLSRKTPIKPMSEDAARQRHENRQPYIALIGGADNPRFIVDVAGDWVSVSFLDSRQRTYLSCDFKELEPGKLFLRGAYHWEYEAESDTATSNTIFNFSKKGHIVVAKHSAVTDEVQEFETTFSIEEDCESYPRFGEYASLCKEERVPV